MITNANALATLANLTPRCCQLGQCEWVSDLAPAIGDSLGDTLGGRWPIGRYNVYNATVLQREL